MIILFDWPLKLNGFTKPQWLNKLKNLNKKLDL